MARSANQKLKCLYLRQFLLQNTDEEHPATIPQMVEYLARHDIPAERKSLYDDIDALRQWGLDVEYRKAQNGGYYVASRDFQLPELKLLVDAVQSSKFLSLRKSNELISKLEKLASRYEAQALRRQVYVTHRVKNMNESIYYNVDALHSAIAAGSRITFRYFDWDTTGKKSYRHGGKRYQVSPWALLWDDENYYLVGYDAEHGERRHYRVDKMESITQTGEKRLGQALFAGFDPAEYSRKVFGMYGGGGGGGSRSASPCNSPTTKTAWPISSLTASAVIRSSSPPRPALPSPWRSSPARSSSHGSPVSAPR